MIRRSSSTEQGTIIIMVMWILAILSLFAVGLGYRSSIELKLTSYYLDKTKSSYIAKNAINMVFFHIANDPNRKVDAYMESWGNSSEAFFEMDFGDAKVTVSHFGDTTDKEPVVLYGASDEAGKININTIPEAILKSDYWKETYSMDDEFIKVLSHWRKKDKTNKELDAWYETTYNYKARHGEIQLLQELHFLKNFYTSSSEKNRNRAKLKDIITCWGSGQVNMNTASKQVLEALFVMESAQKQTENSTRDELIRMIIEYRNGEDGQPGTADDKVFENVNIETAIGTHDAQMISMLNYLRSSKLIGVTSDFFNVTATISIEAKNYTKQVTAVLSRSKDFARKLERKKKRTATISVIDDKKDDKLDPMLIIKYSED